MKDSYFQEALLPLFQRLQPFFRERMGGWKRGDNYMVSPYCMIWTVGNRPCSHKSSAAIWLPRTIDDSSPEAQKRSLWGMAVVVDCYYHNEEKEWRAYLLSDKSGRGATPTEAILKALCQQEGV